MPTPITGKTVKGVTLDANETSTDCFMILFDDGSAMCIRAGYDWNHNETDVTWSYRADVGDLCEGCMGDVR